MTEDAAPAPILMLGDDPVVLDSRLAAGFGVEIREINQAFTRNPSKFDARHGARLTQAQWDFLKSQDVIPKRSGRGGSNVPPMVYTQKGMVRLATVLTSPRALEFTDAMIDLFIDVQQQLARGVRAPQIRNPGQLIPPPQEELSAFRKIRRGLLAQIDALMNAHLGGQDGPTVRDGLSDTGAALYKDLQARLKTRSLTNDKLAAETLRLLEEVETLRQDRTLKARRAGLEDQALQLENIRQSVALLKEMEPPALTGLSRAFLPEDAPVLRLPSPDAD